MSFEVFVEFVPLRLSRLPTLRSVWEVIRRPWHRNAPLKARADRAELGMEGEADGDHAAKRFSCAFADPRNWQACLK